MSITRKHSDYEKHIKTWQKLDDVCEGQEVIKSRKEKYLPVPALFENTKDPNAKVNRYSEYIQRAIFPGVTSTTLANHIGLAFGKVPVFNRPDELEYLERNADGSGRSIWQKSQTATRLVEKNYRCGIYVDFPSVDPSRNREEDKSKKAYAMIHVIPAGDIEDWDDIVVENQRKLSYVKIRETVKERNGFDVSEFDQYRCLWLEQSGTGFVYAVEVWRKDDKGNWFVYSKAYPQDYHGRTWDFIPFTFCGAVDNSEEINTPPLYELAELELSYYRSSADVEESAFIVGQPTLCLPNITEAQYKMLKEEGAQVGSRTGIPCDGKFIQADENGLAYKRMQDKWDQMKEMGARLIEVGSANKTATQADNENSIQHSILSLVVANVSEAFSNALLWCAKFMLPDREYTVKELSYNIAQDFNKPKYDPARSRLIYESCLNGTMPWFVWYHYEQTGTFSETKWEEIVNQIEAREDGVDED